MTAIKIDPTDLARWADRQPSRAALPELVRRLLREREPVRWVDMPCGDSTGKRGWDGVVTAEPGGHFAPVGVSCWEMGTSDDAGSKANDDYGTRTRNTPPERRAAAAFVFVTPRRWHGKRDWIDAKTAEDAWREVRAYDADDLERWLDEQPRVARWFAATQLRREGVEDWVDPVIGWDPAALSLDRTELGWLTWRARLSTLFGRHRERVELLRWAREGGGVSFRFLIGDGGTGKTRLAHEIADELSGDPAGRAAGLVPADKPLPLDIGRAGCFLLVDYPEEKRDAVRERLIQLAYEPHDPARAVRVLFLTRNDDRYWGPLTDDTGAHTRMAPPIHLPSGLGAEEAWAMFRSALERVPRKPGTPEPTGIDEAAFTAWLARVEVNQRPLLIAAAAIQAIAEPTRPVFTLDARTVIDALARRESARLRRLALAHKLPEHALERLTALAAVRGALDNSVLRRLADPALDLGLGPREGLIDRLERTGLLPDGTLRPPEPDIVAASLLVDTLSHRPADASEWLWAAIEGAEAETFKRLDRLTWDAEYVLLRHDHRLSRWLATMLAGRVERCRAMAGLMSDDTLPAGLVAAGATVFHCLADTAGDEDEKASYLNKLSLCLSAAGDGAGALAAIGEAMAVYRRLAATNPARYEPDLAASLNNLSVHLSAAGDGAGALAAIGEAVAMYRRLAATNPARYEPDLAISLNTMSNRLSDAGNGADALAAIGEAVAFRRRLAATNPARYVPDLAMSLSNLSNRLSDGGEGAGALAAIGEAVAVYRRLAAMNPARYTPELGRALNNLADLTAERGDLAGALELRREAKSLIEPFAHKYPQSWANRLSRVNDESLRNLLARTGRRLKDEELLELAFLLVLDGWSAPWMLTAPSAKGLRKALDRLTAGKVGTPISDILDRLRAARPGAAPDPLWLAWTLDTEADALAKIGKELFGDAPKAADLGAASSINAYLDDGKALWR